MSAVANTDDSAHVTRQNEADAQERLAAAVKLTREPGLASFFDALYRNAAPDDVNRYTPEGLAALARLVLARLAQHKPGSSDVSLFCAASRTRPMAKTTICWSRSTTTSRSCSTP